MRERGKLQPAGTRLSGVEYYRRRYRHARVKADLWISLLEACYHYTVPNRNLFYWTSQYQGAQKNARVYDTTAVSGVNNFVSKLQGSLTPPQQNWAILEPGTDIPEDQKEQVQHQLQETTDIIFNYLRHSNFDLAIHECYYDLAIGTAALICNEGDEASPLLFYSVPAARLAIEENHTGLIDSCYRWWDEIRIADIEIMWPKAKLTPIMKQLLLEDPNASVKNLVEGTMFVRNDKAPYIYILMYESELLLEERMYSSPWITFRWSKVNNEIFGRGPVIDALPSILSLNELARLELAAANFNVSKPFMAYSDGVFNPWTFKIEPNTIIPVSPNSSGQWPIQPFPDSANPNFMQLTANDLRMQINSLLFADPLGPIEGPQKTATELALRQRNLAEQIGPAFTRLQQEFLSRLINRVIYILQKKGLIDKLVVNGTEIQVRYKSPLTAAQGQQDVQNFLQFYQILQNTQGPESALVNLNPAKFPAWLASKMSVDVTALNTQEEMQAFYEQQSEKAQMQEMMMMEQGGELAQQPLPPTG
jgi:hypothetical protein